MKDTTKSPHIAKLIILTAAILAIITLLSGCDSSPEQDQPDTSIQNIPLNQGGSEEIIFEDSPMENVSGEAMSQ